MSRIAATTNGRPWSCSGLSAISTITSVPSRRLATSSTCEPIGRGIGLRAYAWRNDS